MKTIDHVDIAHAGIFHIVLFEWLNFHDHISLDIAACSRPFRQALHAVLRDIPMIQPFSGHRKEGKLWNRHVMDALRWMTDRGVHNTQGTWSFPQNAWARALKDPKCLAILAQVRKLKIVASGYFHLAQLEACPLLTCLTLQGALATPRPPLIADQASAATEAPEIDMTALLPNLQQLTLSESTLTMPLLVSLGAHSKLTSVHLLSCGHGYLSNASPEDVIACKPFFQKVKKLFVTGSDSLQILKSHFDHSSTVTEAEFSHFCYDADDSCLIYFLHAVSSITHLRLVYCTHYLPVGMEQRILPHLQHLHLQGCFVPAEMLQLLTSSPIVSLECKGQRHSLNNESNAEQLQGFYEKLRVFHTDTVTYKSVQLQHHLFYLPVNRLHTVYLDNWKRPDDTTDDLVNFFLRSQCLENLTIVRCAVKLLAVIIGIQKYCPLIRQLALEDVTALSETANLPDTSKCSLMALTIAPSAEFQMPDEVINIIIQLIGAAVQQVTLAFCHHLTPKVYALLTKAADLQELTVHLQVDKMTNTSEHIRAINQQMTGVNKIAVYGWPRRMTAEERVREAQRNRRTLYGRIHNF